MKITTWNVNGIRAVIRKSGFQWLEALDTDVLCLQEVKARPDQIPDEGKIFPGYHLFWNPAVKPGYSGVAVYSKVLPDDVQFGIGDDRFDNEGRVIRLTFADFVLFNVYFPSGQRGLDRVGYKLEFYECLLKQIDALHSQDKKVIVTGDFNTAHTEIDLANPKSNQKTSGFLPEERAWIDIYVAHGLADAFRRKYPDRVQYTWWTYTSFARSRNVGWRLDYHMISEALLPQVEEVIIHDQVQGSDHCPVTLAMNMPGGLKLV